MTPCFIEIREPLPAAVFTAILKFVRRYGKLPDRILCRHQLAVPDESNPGNRPAIYLILIHGNVEDGVHQNTDCRRL